MRHTLRLNGIVVGWSDLEDLDPIAGRARGHFRPGIGYELVQPIFQMYAEAVTPTGTVRDQEKLDRYHRSRDQLPLELIEDATGRPLEISAVHIADYATPEHPEARELDVLVRDEDYWRRFG